MKKETVIKRALRLMERLDKGEEPDIDRVFLPLKWNRRKESMGWNPMPGAEMVLEIKLARADEDDVEMSDGTLTEGEILGVELYIWDKGHEIDGVSVYPMRTGSYKEAAKADLEYLLGMYL